MLTSLHDLLEFGVQAEASDWHIREGKNTFIRINSELMEVENSQVSADFLQQLISQICTAKDIELFENSGDANFAFIEDGIGRFRANLHKQCGKIGLALRYIKDQIPNITDCMLPPILKQIAGARNGIILITGATGCGKSTTMAALVDYINRHQNCHIMTIEDPIEFIYEDKNSIIQQREVGIDIPSYEAALFHVLRQDPDVIVIGEIRDRAAFDTAIKAAQTGHLVIGTLHTQNVITTLTRILDMYSEEEHTGILNALALTLQAVICQRLLPATEPGKRIPACEILRKCPIVEKLITENSFSKLPAAIEANEQLGMQTFNKHMLELIKTDLITEQTALEYTDQPEKLKMNLRGVFLSSQGGIIS